jgi:hypothetical protein
MIPSAPVADLALSLIACWLLGILLHWWPRLRASARRRLAVSACFAGVAFLLAAIRAEGLRESAITSMVIVGPASHTETAAASASLHYYVLSGACLLLGFVDLAAGDALSRWLAPRFLASSVAVAWLVTLVRFLLERSAAPPLLSRAVGVTGMAPVAGAYIATCLHAAKPGWRPLLRTLAGYGLLARTFVALVGTLATMRALGTHYDVSALTVVPLPLVGGSRTFLPGGIAQVFWLTLLPQLLLWPLITVAAGAAGALPARALLRRQLSRLPGRLSPAGVTEERR